MRAVHVCVGRLTGTSVGGPVQSLSGNPKVTVERLVAGWSEATGAAVGGRHVLAIQDTSEINFRTTRTRTRGLGELAKAWAGVRCCTPWWRWMPRARLAWAWLPARCGPVVAGLVCRT